MKTKNNKLESNEIQRVLKNQKNFDPLSFYVFLVHKKIVVPVPMNEILDKLNLTFVDVDMKEEIKVHIYDYIRQYLMDDLFGREIETAIDLHYKKNK